ncbi:MAG: hypothetical protein WDO73_07145 [Ignavibacteriota bacterium]
MKDQFVKALIVGLLVVAVGVGGILFMQRGAHMDLKGSMNIRLHATDKDTTLAIIDLNLANPASYGFQVSDVEVNLESKAGDATTRVVSKVDVQRLQEAMPELGSFHPTLYTKYVVPPQSTGRYTLLAQFSFPQQMLVDRKQFVVRIREVNGKVAEITEK